MYPLKFHIKKNFEDRTYRFPVSKFQSCKYWCFCVIHFLCLRRLGSGTNMASNVYNLHIWLQSSANGNRRRTSKPHVTETCGFHALSLAEPTTIICVIMRVSLSFFKQGSHTFSRKKIQAISRIFQGFSSNFKAQFLPFSVFIKPKIHYFKVFFLRFHHKCSK